MRHSVTFKLEKPNLAKWGLYTSLMPEVDSLCSDHGIIVEKRTCNIDTYEISEVIVATCQKRLFTAKHKVVELLQRNNIETTTAENILTDNLFDELSTTTRQHRQLSLL